MISDQQRLQIIELVLDITQVGNDNACLMHVEDNLDKSAEHLAQQALRLIDDAYGKSDERRNSTDLSELAASIRQRLSTEPGKHAKRGSFSVAYACAMIGLQPRTYFNRVKQIRNEADCVLAIKDKRTLERKGPSKDPKALSQDERNFVICRYQQPDVRHLSIEKATIKLLDDPDEDYICSCSTAYRVLGKAGMLKVRPASTRRRGHSNNKREAHWSYKINEVWSYDITYLNGPNGVKYYGIAIMDHYSRYVVHCDVLEKQDEDSVSSFLSQAFAKYQIVPKQLVLHTDNGSQMRSAVTVAVLKAFGVEESHSRPLVSNDNAPIERLWNTAKHSTYGLTKSIFRNLQEVKQAFTTAMHNYNNIGHSSLKDITPYARYHGLEKEVLEARMRKVAKGREKHPERWGNRKLRDFTPAGPQVLNPHFLKKDKAGTKSHN